MSMFYDIVNIIVFIIISISIRSSVLNDPIIILMTLLVGDGRTLLLLLQSVKRVKGHKFSKERKQI